MTTVAKLLVANARLILALALVAAGIGFLTYAAALIWPPLVPLAAGIALTVAGLLLELDPRRDRR